MNKMEKPVIYADLTLLEQQAVLSVMEPEYKLVNEASKLGRNEMCACGSGKKAKKCHQSLGALEIKASYETLSAVVVQRRSLSVRKIATWARTKDENLIKGLRPA